MVPEQATAADPAFSETPVREHAAAMDFAARWPDLPESPNLDASELAAISNSYADTQTAADAEEQMPLTWPVTEAGRAGQQQDPAGQAAFGSVFLAGALALGSLSLVGGVFRLARRSRQRYLRDPWRAAAGRSGPRRHMRADFRELTGSSSTATRRLRFGECRSQPIRLTTSKQASQNSCKICSGPERRTSRRDHSRHLRIIRSALPPKRLGSSNSAKRARPRSSYLSASRAFLV